MPKKIALIQGHPDPSRPHLCHALAHAYTAGAAEAGHTIDIIDVARLDFPLLRSADEFNSAPPPVLQPAINAITSADHLVIIFPLWLGTAPALVKAFLEQVMRPGVAFSYEKRGTRKLLTGRSAHVIVTMGMPTLLYRTYFLGHGINWLCRNVFSFVGFSPVRTTMFGMIENAPKRRQARWFKTMRANGIRAR